MNDMAASAPNKKARLNLNLKAVSGCGKRRLSRDRAGQQAALTRTTRPGSRKVTQRNATQDKARQGKARKAKTRPTQRKARNGVGVDVEAGEEKGVQIST